ncbi:MAG: protein kinase [Deltaproteobacteria bacterium]|nr:protein kinase [Deltaproteobacteria bacterium]
MSESSNPNADAKAELTQTTESDEAYCAACNQSFTIDAQFCPNDGAMLIKLKARPDTLIGRVFDNRYEVRAPLGHGGMGTVYRGWQLSVDREIAIKVIHPKLANDRNVAKRFLREARLASRLSQANIVSVYEFGQTDDGILYLAMELLRGRPLSKDLEAMRPLPMKRVKSIGMQMCDALDAAHSQGIIHRDLKPGNIVILDEPVGRDLVKILDFGLAKSLVQDNTSLVTKTDAILGTPLYMPPEQILGKTSDQTADLYSLGCILYQLSTGRPPYVGENVNVVLASHVRDPVPQLGEHVPADLTALIQKLMRKEPADRYQRARDVHAAIEALADDPASVLTTGAWKGSPPPGVKSDVIRSVPADSFAHETATSANPPLTNPSLDRPPLTRRWLMPLVALFVLGGGGVVAWRMMRSDSPTTRGGAAIDADKAANDVTPGGSAFVVESDAVVASSPDAAVPGADAQLPADAARAPSDARRPPPRLPDARIAPPDARVVPDAGRPTPDAASLDVIPARDAGVVKPDAPTIDLIPTAKKKS